MLQQQQYLLQLVGMWRRHSGAVVVTLILPGTFQFRCSPCVCWVLRPLPIIPKHACEVDWNSKLSAAVNMSVNCRLSAFSPVMSWRLAQGFTLLFMTAGRGCRWPPATLSSGISGYRWRMDGWLAWVPSNVKPEGLQTIVQILPAFCCAFVKWMSEINQRDCEGCAELWQYFKPLSCNAKTSCPVTSREVHSGCYLTTSGHLLSDLCQDEWLTVAFSSNPSWFGKSNLRAWLCTEMYF